MTRPPFKPNTLVYDEDCDLCRWIQDILRRWDSRRAILFLAMQDPVFRQWFPERDSEDLLQGVLFIDETGRVREGFDAVRMLLPLLRLGRPAAFLLSLPGGSWMGRKLFEWVARNRYVFQRPGTSRF